NHRFNEESLLKLRTKLANFPICRDLAFEDIPWKPSNHDYEPGTVGLHNEIKDFYNYIKPTDEEQYARDVVVSKIKDVVHSMWPDCEVDVFGSFKTGLYLPTSDIDMVIFGKWEALPLHTLKHALSSSGISSEITVLDKATVPIVKMTDKETGLKVDISFNMINSVRAAVLIQDYMRTFPCMPYLVFVLKQFLLQRNLNEVWTGGLSSYALILMVVRFLQDTISSKWVSENVNLGTLLLEFFELYGRLFNYSKTAIRVTDRGEYVQKEVVLQNMVHSVRPSILCIEDPLCPGNDVGRRSYQAMLVKQAFEYAYLVLSSAVLPHYQFLHSRKEISILGRIIRISKESMDCRQRIRVYGRGLLDALKPHQVPTDPTQKPIIMTIQPTSTMSIIPMNWPTHRPPYGLPTNLPIIVSNPVPIPPQLHLQLPSTVQPNAPLSSQSVAPVAKPPHSVSQFPVLGQSHVQPVSGDNGTTSTHAVGSSKEELSNSDELSNTEESPVLTPSTTEDAVAELHERPKDSDKPGEYSVLAEELQFPVLGQSHVQPVSGDNGTTSTHAVGSSKEELSNSDELSNTEESPVLTPSTTEDAVAELHERPKDSDKPGEYSVLAEELASLSTLINTDGKVSSVVESTVPHAEHEDSKRRCLRPVSPVSSAEPAEVHLVCSSKPQPMCESLAFHQRTVCEDRSWEEPEKQSGLDSVPTNIGRSRKQGTKASRQQLAHIPVSHRDNQFSRFISLTPSTSSALAFGQKRHVTGARRAK
ncbi:hypothetical protein T265_14168, partial [Opisthorchis viverrini]